MKDYEEVLDRTWRVLYICGTEAGIYVERSSRKAYVVTLWMLKLEQSRPRFHSFSFMQMGQVMSCGSWDEAQANTQAKTLRADRMSGKPNTRRRSAL
jgi:hypothetical protein